MKYFVTGASGQVGHSLVNYLIKEKGESPADVVCLVRTPDTAKDLQKLNVTIVKGTVNEESKIKQLLDEFNIEIVFHTAAISDPSVDKELIFSTNIDGSNAVLKAFVESHAHCFVFSSSISVYDSYLTADGKKISEEADIGSLIEGDAYARSKRVIEKEIQKLQALYPEKHFKIARIGPICGTHDRIVLPKLISIMSKKSLPKLINKGMLEMSIIAPEDVARGMVFLAQNSTRVPDTVYNITGELVTFKEMFDLVADYYAIQRPKFSVPLWFFKMLRPIMWLTRVLMPNNGFVKLVFSETALAFFSNNYEFDRTKIESLGFKFLYTPLQSIKMGLETMDPDKKLINPDL
jgi:nucleoside-diphosphate-sugar epimerase